MPELGRCNSELELEHCNSEPVRYKLELKGLRSYWMMEVVAEVVCGVGSLPSSW